jgi:hypothetical protein
MGNLFDMNSWTASQFVRFGSRLAVVVSAGWMVGSLTAGEAIQFSNAKIRPEPGIQNKLAKDKLSTVERTRSSAPLDSVNPTGPARDDKKKPRTREEKQRNLAKIEDKNWAYVEKGQLQEEEEEKTAFGVRDYDVETGGKEKTTTDLWFSTKNDNNGRSSNAGRSSGNARASGASARGAIPNRPGPAPEPDETEGGLKLGKAGGKQAEQSVVGPPSNERLLQNFFAPEPGSGRLNETFGETPGDQTRRGDAGLRSVETSPGTRAQGLGGGDTLGALGFGRELGAKPPSGSPLLMDSPRNQPSSSLTPPSGAGPSGFGLNPGSRTTPFLQPQQPNTLTPGSSDPFARPTRPSSGR